MDRTGSCGGDETEFVGGMQGANELVVPPPGESAAKSVSASSSAWREEPQSFVAFFPSPSLFPSILFCRSRSSLRSHAAEGTRDIGCPQHTSVASHGSASSAGACSKLRNKCSLGSARRSIGGGARRRGPVDWGACEAAPAALLEV